MLLHPKGIDRHGRGPATGRTTQDAIAGSIVEVVFRVAGTVIPPGQMVQVVIGQGRRRAREHSARDIAPAIVTTGIEGPTQTATGSPTGISPGQLVRMRAVTIEILSRASRTIDRR